MQDLRVLEAYGWLSWLYVAGLLSVTAWFTDRWLVAEAGPYARLIYVGFALLVFWRITTRIRSATSI